MSLKDILFMRNTGAIIPDADIFDVVFAKKLRAAMEKLVTILGNPLHFLAKKAQMAVSTKVTLEPIQEGSGDPSPTNIRPISGRSSVEIKCADGESVVHDTVTISFGETVYSGTLDVETGVLTVDKKLITIKDYDFSYTSSSGGVFRTDFDDIESMTTTLISSALRTTNVSISGMPIYSVRGGSGSARQRIFIKMPDDITTRTALNNAIGDETICYPLATPRTIPLTPEQIQILKGQNYIWVEDEGASIELTYKTPKTS